MEGLPAPEIRAEETSAGAPFDWAELRGKVVLVDFWGTWCGPCVLQLPHLQQLYMSHREKGFEIVGVHSAHGAESVGTFLEKRPLPWPVIVDQTGTNQKAYQVTHYPSLFLIDRNGRLRVALAHEKGLEEAVAELLREETE